MQTAYTLDEVTKAKIVKGALIALSCVPFVGILLLAWNMDIERTAIVSLVAWLVPVSVNAIKEFVKGK